MDFDNLKPKPSISLIVRPLNQLKQITTVGNKGQLGLIMIIIDIYIAETYTVYTIQIHTGGLQFSACALES